MFSEVVLTLATLAILLVIWCAIHRLRQAGKPGFKTWPLLGATVDIFANYYTLHDYILWNFQVKNTSTLSAPVPTYTYIITADPANVEHILKTNFHNYPKGKTFHERFEPLLGDGIFNTDGEDWKVQRKTASIQFSSRVLRDYSSGVFKEYALKLAEIIIDAANAHKTLDMQDLLMRMAIETISIVVFGVNLGVLCVKLPENEFASALDKCNGIISYRFADPIWKLRNLVGIGEERHLDKHIRTMNKFIYNVISQRRLQIMSGQTAKQDLLSRFMMMGEDISDTNLRDVVLNFLIAGRDTTAGTLTYFIYMITTHPSCEQRIRQELIEFERTEVSEKPTPAEEDDLLGLIRNFMEHLTYDSLSKLQYLHAAINETLRLYPGVPLNFKGILRNDILPDGTQVKAGDIISFHPYSMGRMKSVWGEDAAEFRPERWFKNGEWDFNVSPFKFIAFQAGPRICLGKDSAYLQMKMTAAVLCRFFEFQLVPNQDLQYRMMATLALANGLKVTPRVRNLKQ